MTFYVTLRYLENVAKAKTSNALSKLISLAPSYATLLEEIDKKLTERKIPSELIQVSDLLKIFPGERVPVDGIVEYGESSLDESLLTGEPFPVSKKVGDQVITGSVNTSGVLHVRAVRVGDETTVSQIVKLVSQAQSSKAPIQASADRVASIFVPTVVFLGVFTFILWMYIILITGWIPSSFPKDSDAVFVCLSMCISVIVAACPCALGLATPTAVMVQLFNFRLAQVSEHLSGFSLRVEGHYQLHLPSKRSFSIKQGHSLTVKWSLLISHLCNLAILNLNFLNLWWLPNPTASIQ